MASWPRACHCCLTASTRTAGADGDRGGPTPRRVAKRHQLLPAQRVTRAHQCINQEYASQWGALGGVAVRHIAAELPLLPAHGHIHAERARRVRQRLRQEHGHLLQHERALGADCAHVKDLRERGACTLAGGTTEASMTSQCLHFARSWQPLKTV